MTTFKLNYGRSEFAVEGRSSIHPLIAATNTLDGYLEVELLPNNQPDLSAPVKGRLEVYIAELKSGNPLYDFEAHRRVDTQRYPKIVLDLLELQEVEPLRRYRVICNLSFRGTTQRVEGDLTVTHLDDQGLEAHGEVALDSRDFGLDPPKLIGLKVYSDFRARLKLVAERVN